MAFVLIFTTNGFAQLDSLVDTVAGKQEMEFQESVEEQAVGDIQTLRQFIIDSLQLVHEESFLELKDSIATLYNNQIADILDQTGNEKAALEYTVQLLDSTIRSIRDSLMILGDQPQILEDIGAGYDLILEAKYFNYEKTLKREEKKSKSGFRILSSDIENIHPFQIEELENYIDRFHPDARCDSVQDYLTQLYIRQQDWTSAEISLIKFIYLYAESPLYEEIKTIRSGIFQTEKSYKKYSDFLMNIVGTTPAYPKMDIRYFKFIELLKDFPDPSVRAHFIKEARKFLDLYPFSSQASKACLWIAENYAQSQRSQSAFVTYKRLMIFYPNSTEMPLALYQTARTQEKDFEEYQNAIDTYQQFIEQFPGDTLTAFAHNHIAKIAEVQLKNWEKAIEEYQTAADLFQANNKPEMSIKILNRKAVILANVMNLIQDAVATYLSIDERFPGTTGSHEAIIAAGDLHNRHKQFESAISQYMNLFEKYPDSDKTLPALERTVKIYNEELGDQDKTIETLNLIITHYPKTKSEARAKKLLKKLEKTK
jgi:TolA-binding protein